MSPSAPSLDLDDRPITWADFVVLSENTSAMRAARRLARGFTHPHSRSRVPIPLVLHGGTGVGKSFLVQTLVRELIADPHGHTIQLLIAADIDLPAEGSTTNDELVDAKSSDLLVIEDLQHLPSRSVGLFTQLLDDRLRRRQPTVITANHGPAGLKSFPRRLTSRLAGGLVVQLEPLRLRSRETLIAHFATTRQLHLADDALAWIARHTPGSGVRPLLGAVERLRALSKGRPTEWTLDEVREALETETSDRRGPVERIVNRVAGVFGVKPKDMLGSCRQKAVLVPRQVAMYLAREGAKLPLVKIGTAFGGRDHSTVLHACKKITEAMKTDAKLRRTVRDLKTECR